VEVVLFLTWRTPHHCGAPPLAAYAQFLAGVPGATRARLHVPATATDPYLNDRDAPSLVAQVYFRELDALESACGPNGALQELISRRAHRWNAEAVLSQQAMAVRAFGVPQPGGAAACTYLVAYHGEPNDFDAWLGHYRANHVPLMLRLPGLRALEIHTRLDYVSALPAARETCVQRNQVVFDSASALTAALNSPVRHEMRADYEASPPFAGHNTHYPMTSHAVSGIANP
jgi:uncharacterized protein (TIGR02118 family)